MRREGNTIIADDGMWLTQYPDIQWFSPMFSLGCNDREENYQEVTDEFKREWEEEHSEPEPEENLNIEEQ